MVLVEAQQRWEGLAALEPGTPAVLQVTIHSLPPRPTDHIAHRAGLCPGQWPSALVALRPEAP